MSIALAYAIGAVVIVASLLGKYFFSPEKKCPDCGEPRPRIPIALLGGLVCRRCGCEVDILGKKVLTDPVEMLECIQAMKEQLEAIQAKMDRLARLLEEKDSN